MHARTVYTRPSFSTPAKYEGRGMRLIIQLPLFPFYVRYNLVPMLAAALPPSINARGKLCTAVCGPVSVKQCLYLCCWIYMHEAAAANKSHVSNEEDLLKRSPCSSYHCSAVHACCRDHESHRNGQKGTFWYTDTTVFRSLLRHSVLNNIQPVKFCSVHV